MAKCKCLGCGERFEKESMIKVNVCRFHSFDCVTAYGLKKVRKAQEKQLLKAQKEQKKKYSKRKREFYDNDIKTRKAAAKTACHKYIQARDWENPCICCGRPFKKSFHAGHFKESGNNPKIRYHEDNINLQSEYCNRYQGGNSDDYEGRLRLKIGDDRVDYLLANKGGTVKRTAQDYKQIEDYYKAKLMELTA